MDVVCGRCRAEYEFDDALISERGTTVRCTSCGLQFKVFPPAGLRAPEEWNVLDPGDREAPPRKYESLRDLQKAIARGEVLATHLLSRGDERPRPLAEIVELQPLLRQPRSDHPPPPNAEPPPPLGNPAALDSALAEDASSQRSNWDADAIVPAREESEQSSGPGSAAAQPSRPRIRSALSIHAGPDQRTTPPPSTGSRDLSMTSIAPRASLRSTLASTYPASTSGAVAPKAAEQQRPSSVPPPPRPEQEAPLPPPVEPEDEERPSYTRPSSTLAAPVNPRITEAAQDFSGQLTPTPGAMKSIRSVDAEPNSAHAGVPLRRGARSGTIVMAVVIGAVAFLGFANREKIAGMLGSSQVGAPGKRPQTVPLSDETRKGLIAVDVAWIQQHLLGVAADQVTGVPAERQGEFFRDLERSGEGESWMKVDLLRAAGQLNEARALSGKLPHGEQSAYSLSLLDLAESPQDPPWPVILERLREASIGEGPPYLATVVYIHALQESGEKVQAAAEFQAFSQMKGAKDSPLFAPLEALVQPAEPAESSDRPARGLEQPTPPREAPVPPQEGRGQAAPPSEETKTEAQEPKPREIPAGVQQKVEQADALWRGGDRDGALALYRQVVAAIGTKHFLGQRAKARIQQAEREKAPTN